VTFTERLGFAGRAAFGRRLPLQLVALAAIGPVLVLVPLVYSVVQALHVAGPEAVRLLFRPLVGQLLVNTIGIALATTLVCAVVGTLAAWFVERTEFPGRGLFASLCAVPLAIPAFITSYAWVSMSMAFEQFDGALLVVSCSYFPLVYLPVAAALRGMDPALEETARSLGVGRLGIWFRVVLPQLRPALFGGMLLVVLNTLVEFGAFTLLRFRTFTTEIFAEYRIGFNGPQASLLAVVLILLCLLCLFAEAKFRGRARYARVDRGTRRRLARHALGKAAILVFLGFAGLVIVTIGVPLGMIAYWLTQHNSAAMSPVAASVPLLLDAALASIKLGLCGAAFTLALALPLGFLATRYDGRLVSLLERAAYLAQGVPGIVVALALIALTVQNLRPLYQSTALLVMAYGILFLPLAVVSVRTTLAQVQPRLEDAGRSLGLSRLAVAWRVVLPLAGPGIGAGAAIVFVSVVTELTATLLLAPIGTQTLATELWADTSTMAFAAGGPYAALMAALSLLSTWLLAGRFGRVGEARQSSRASRAWRN
jgi:iron(III) transport system permease protein